MIRFLCLLIMLLLTTQQAYAVDTGVDTTKGKRQTKERRLEQRKSLERKDSLHMKLTIDALILPELVKLEKKYLKDCLVLSRPRQPKHFGIDVEVREGVYDSIKSTSFELMAKTNAIVPQPEKMRKYAQCLALTGAIIAQANAYLIEMLPPEGVSRSDLETLVRISVEKSIYDGITDPKISNLLNTALNDTTPCRFNNSLTLYRCGSLLLDLSSQKLLLADVILFGGPWYGYNTEYTVTESSAKAKALVLSMQKSWDKQKSKKNTVSISHFIPKP